MARDYRPVILDTEAAINKVKLDILRSIARAVSTDPPARKMDIVPLLVKILRSPGRVRALYDALDENSQAAVREATHHEHGLLDQERFSAKYGDSADFRGIFGKPGAGSSLGLFFPETYPDAVLPGDLRKILLTFVPPPEPLQVQGVLDELPERVRPPWVDREDDDEEERELRVRPTARSARLDVGAVLRLIDAGEVRVSDKTHRPSQATLKAVAAVLDGGDWYAEEDREEYKEDPGWDLTIKPFAWPMLVQAAKLAELAGTRLKLTPAGRKATARPAHEILRTLWNGWQKTTLVDEFNRIEAIKGQGRKGRLSAVAPRRQVLVEALRLCPPGKWVPVEELFRLLEAGDPPLEVARDVYGLYLGEMPYGDLGSNGGANWEMIEGRYTLVFLLEYAATLGVVDVAYIAPSGARNDFGNCWGAEDLSCLSRYDGLLYFRVNALGAWCLGLAEKYVPGPESAEKLLRVLPNLEVVSAERRLAPGDVLLLERFAERRSDAVWQLTVPRVLTAVEEGLAVRELEEFLLARSVEPLPQTVTTFLADLQARAGQVRDLGAARLVECADAATAQLLAHDRRLRGLCDLAGERRLVFRATDEVAVRKAIKELGYVLPLGGEGESP